MARIRTDVDVDADRDLVWAHLRDISRHVEWMRDAKAIRFQHEQRTGVGTTFECDTAVGPLRTTDVMTVTEWVEGERIGVHHRGVVTGEGAFVIDGLGDGSRTRVRWEERLRFPWWLGGRVGALVARPILRSIWARNLAGLARQIHAAVPGTDAGPIIGRGRDAEVREFGPGRVIRTTRDGRDQSEQFAVMRHVHANGFPVPAVYEHPDRSAIVMDRVEGPTMLDIATRRPWRLRRNARVLADLHNRLAAIDAPPQLTKRAGNGDKLVHLDLHPDNVIMSADGPMVIDWTNAARGSPELDAALTIVILRTAPAPMGMVGRTVVAGLRKTFASTFARAVDVDATFHIAEAAELRLADQRLTPSEREQLFDLARG